MRIAMMVISKCYIKEVYKIRTDELRLELQQALNNNDEHLFTLVQGKMEEINRVNQKYERFMAP